MAYALGPVKSHVRAAANHFGPKHGIKTIGGWRAVGSVEGSDHPRGLALDFMTRDKARGDALTADILANAAAWNVTYVIWWRRIWSADRGWRSYSGPVPHTDHVHVSFGSEAGSGQGTVTPVGNPLIPDSVEKLAAFIGDPATWRRVAYYVFGALLVLFGVALMVGNAAGAGTILKTVRKVTK